MPAKIVGRRVTKKFGRPEPVVGHAYRVMTQGDGTVTAELVEIDRSVYVVRTAAGKVYRVLRAEIL